MALTEDCEYPSFNCMALTEKRNEITLHCTSSRSRSDTEAAAVLHVHVLLTSAVVQMHSA